MATSRWSHVFLLSSQKRWCGTIGSSRFFFFGGGWGCCRVVKYYNVSRCEGFEWVVCLMVALVFCCWNLFGGYSYSNFCSVWFNYVLGRKICFHRHANMIGNYPGYRRISQFVQKALMWVKSVMSSCSTTRTSVVTMIFPTAGACFHHLQTHKMHAEMQYFLQVEFNINHTGPCARWQQWRWWCFEQLQ